jgi:release factor glutamine methyltransferase
VPTDPAQRAPLDLVRLAAEYLKQKGVANPRLDAEVLLAHVLAVQRLQLYLQFDKPLEAGEIAAYREAVRRRARREPVAHITGVREFWSLDFAVDPRVLIPRPETEVLVEAARSRMGGTGSLLDVGTGSGVLAISLLTERGAWRAVATDVSAAALAVASDNGVRRGVEGRLELRLGELFEPVAGERFDAIVANPPYIPSGEIDRLEPEVAVFDPRQALDGGPDGLSVLRGLVARAPEHLTPGGFLAVEFGAGQEAAVSGLFRDVARYEAVELVCDYAGRPRVAVAQRAD